MRKIVTAVVAAASYCSSGNIDVEYRGSPAGGGGGYGGWHGGGWHGGYGWGPGAGFVAGAIVGGALAAPYYYRLATATTPMAVSLCAALRVAAGMEWLWLGRACV